MLTILKTFLIITITESGGMSYNILKVSGTGRENKLCPNAFRADHVNVLADGLDDFLQWTGPVQSLLILAAGQVRLVKRSQIFLKLSLGIPIPVSLTDINIFSYRPDAWM